MRRRRCRSGDIRRSNVYNLGDLELVLILFLSDERDADLTSPSSRNVSLMLIWMIAIFFDVIILDHGGGLRSQRKNISNDRSFNPFV